MKKPLLLFIGLFGIVTSGWAAPVIMVFGDSLSAGYGLNQTQGWVSLLNQQLKQQDYPHHIVNASISGDTTSSARARIDKALARHTPHIIIIELGGNDGLRGLPINHMRQNLATLIERSLDQQVRILLVGMQIPPNYGPAYSQSFAQVYPQLAEKYVINLVPFFFEGLPQSNEYFQADRIHPNAKAQAILLNNIWPQLKPLLDKPL